MLKKINCSVLILTFIMSLFWAKVDISAKTLAAIAKPCLKITKTVDNNKPAPGDVLNFVYQVTNIGTVELYNVTVTESLIDSISPSSVDYLAPGETAAFYGTLTIPSDAIVGSVVSNSAVATGFYNNCSISTQPCTITFTICGQVIPNIPINNITCQPITIINTTSIPPTYINTTCAIDYPQTTPSIPSIPTLPSTGEDHPFWLWEKLFGL